MFFFCVLGRYGKSNDRHRTKKTKHEFNRKKGKSWNDESNKKQIHTCKWKKLTKEWMKRSRQIHCLQGANPVYHRGNGPLGGTLAIFFWRFGMWWEIQRTAEKKNAALKTEKKGKKHGANSPIVSSCRILRGGSNVWAFWDEAVGADGWADTRLGQTRVGQTRFDAFWSGFWTCFFFVLACEKPVSEKPVTEKPVTEKPVSEKPVSEKPVSEKPEWCDSIGVDCLDRPGCHRFISIELGHLGNRGGYKLYQIIYTYN